MFFKVQKLEIVRNSGKCQEIRGNTRKFREMPGNTRKYQEMPGNSGKFREIPGNTRKCQEIKLSEFRSDSDHNSKMNILHQFDLDDTVITDITDRLQISSATHINAVQFIGITAHTGHDILTEFALAVDLEPSDIMTNVQDYVASLVPTFTVTAGVPFVSGNSDVHLMPDGNVCKKSLNFLHFASELWILTKLESPNIIKMNGALIADDLYYIRTPFQPHSFDDFRHKFAGDLKRINVLMNTLSTAVHHMHHRGVAHCDLKPANIVFDTDWEPVIIDFDIGRNDSNDLGDYHDVLATHTYRPPEFYNGFPVTIRPASTDCFSLGVIFLELIIGFNFYQKYDIFCRPNVCNLPKSMYVYLSILLNRDPQKRQLLKLPMKDDLYYTRKCAISHKFSKQTWPGIGLTVRLPVAARCKSV